MEYFPEPYTEERTRKFVERIGERWRELGYGLWAVERKDSGRFIGYIGLSLATFPAHFTPAVELGWRLAADQWGYGYARKGRGQPSITGSAPWLSTKSSPSRPPATYAPSGSWNAF